MALTAVDLLSTIADAVGSVDARWALLLCSLSLLLYCISHRRLSRAKALKLSADKSLQDIESELAAARRDRSMSRLENQILREFLAKRTADKKVSLLLRRYVPKTRDGLAAIVQIGGEGDSVIHDRGFSNKSRETFRLHSSLIKRIKAERFIALDAEA